MHPKDTVVARDTGGMQLASEMHWIQGPELSSLFSSLLFTGYLLQFSNLSQFWIPEEETHWPSLSLMVGRVTGHIADVTVRALWGRGHSQERAHQTVE